MAIKEVLLIEDDPIQAKLACRFLPGSQFNVVTAESIGEATTYLLENTPHVILLDLMLPDMNGIEFIKECKDLIKDNCIIIILSSIEKKKTIDRALKLGAHDYIIKPATRNELVNKLKVHLKQQRTFEKVFEGDLPILDAHIEAELVGLGEANFMLSAPIKVQDEQEINIKSPYLIDLGITKQNYKTEVSYKAKLPSPKLSVFKLIGIKSELITSIRSKVIQWTKVIE